MRYRSRDGWNSYERIIDDEERHKERIFKTKKTLDFIAKHPQGVTAKDFKKADLPIYGITK